jgi:glycosyltransferase involved in cell wall biosynthesis
MSIVRGVAICHFNRHHTLRKVVEGVKNTVPDGTRIVVCDDGSKHEAKLKEMMIDSVEDICRELEVVLIKGPNLGVAANKNRALWALQDCHYLCILEDDLVPVEPGWFEIYEKAAQLSNCHHFCRVQDKEIHETVPAFTAFLKKHGLTPVFASSPRGDLTFLTKTVIKRVGAFNPKFRGAGYAHGEWSKRVAAAGLIGHPLEWLDIAEGRDKIEQIGDREGGRWEQSQNQIKHQLNRNARILKELNANPYIHHPLVLE